MAEFVFVNPSPNMNVAAKALVALGRDVKSVYTKDFVQMRPNNLWAFIGGNATTIVERKGRGEIDQNITMMKKPFFTKRFINQINSKLVEINPALSCGSFADYILFSANLWREDKPDIELSNYTFEEILSKHPSSKIVTSKVPSNNGKYQCVRWRTDFDVADALGDDCYLYFDGKQSHELYRMGDDLVTVSEQKNSLEWLKKINPTFSRFTFEKISWGSYYKNVCPWVIKHSSKVMLINDYSWQGVAAQLPDTWAKAVAKYINGQLKPEKKK